MLVFRKRRVRIHQLDPGPTVEGILIGSLDNHYRLLKPVIYESPTRSHDLAGEAWIPREKVILVETIKP